MAAKVATTRLRKEYKTILQDPPEFIKAHPLESNILDWRFIIEGPPGSVYEGGVYMGRLKFPPAYPMKAPAISMLTPNGRFETDRSLCLSMSEFHPESWSPGWTVATILKGVCSFMLDDEQTTGSIVTTDAKKRELAAATHAFNAAHADFRLFAESAAGAQAASSAAGAQAKPPAAETGERAASCIVAMMAVSIEDAQK